MHRNREKKGISTIIATVFMIAIIILGLGVLTAGLNMQNDLGQVVTERTGLEAEQIKERVEMRDVKIDGNKFNMTLVNTGMLPVKIVRAWVTNTTDTNGWHTLYDNLNYLINPGDSYIGFGQLAPLSSLVAKTDKSYEIKVVTERGTTTSFKILNGVDAKLNARLIAAPALVHPKEQVTITMIVTHNNTLADAVLDIKPPTTPNGGLNPVVITGSGTATWKTGPVPTQDANILRGSTRVYTWTYELDGTDNTVFRFTAQIQGGKSNTATVDVTVKPLKITSTDYSSNSGILTINYTSFRYTQTPSLQWSEGWGVAQGAKSSFRVNVTNNNVTGTFWISSSSVFFLQNVGPANNFAFYIVNSTTPGNPPTNIAFSCPAESPLPANQYCIKLAPGETKRLYFSATTILGTTPETISGNNIDIVSGSILLFGKFASCHTCTGTLYGQNLPFIGLDTS